jgi:uncharacterized protein YjbI with pentapeptide repeats
MIEEQKSDIFLPEQQPAKPVRTLETLLKLYDEGHRNFSGSDLRGATVDIIDNEIENLNLQDIILHRSNLKAIKFRHGYSALKVNLTGSDLRECNLQGADLSSCILDQCNFTDSDLRNATLSWHSCRGSDFMRAKFINVLTGSGTDFTASDFTEADFRSTQLSGNFSYSNFCGTNFQKASFTYFVARGADFSSANLQDVEFPTNKAVDFSYSYYNAQTKFSSNFDPLERKMELIKDEILVDDGDIC